MKHLRPGNLYKDFLVAKCTSGIDGKGRPVKKYESNDSAVIHAVLAQATPQEKARWEQIQHPITHTIVDRGHPKAAETDQLTCGNRKFYVQGVTSREGRVSRNKDNEANLIGSSLSRPARDV